MALGVGGTVVARARAIIEADTRGFDKGVANSERRLKKWQGVAVKAAAAVAVGFAYGAKKAIDAASDLNEEINKSTVVFGKSSKGVLEWSKKSSSAFLMSRRAALAYAGVFGAMFRPMGFTSQAAANMSKKLVQLAGDMASFNNASPEDVLLALRSGLSGEIEPLRKFGIFLNQDRIAAEAVSSGLVKMDVDLAKVRGAQLAVAEATAKHTEAVKKHGSQSAEAAKTSVALQLAESRLSKAMDGKTPKLTAAQKAQATYNIILKDTVLQQGDVARTSGSVANRERQVAAQVEDLQAILGQKLLPAYAGLLGVTTKVVGWATKHATATKILIGVIGGLAAAILAINAALKVARVTMIAFNAVLATNPVILITAAIVALGIALVAAYKKSDTFRRVVDGAFTAVREVVATAVQIIVGYIDKYLGAISSLASAASHLPIVGKKFKGVAGAIDHVREKLRGLDDTIRGGKKGRTVDVALTQTVTNERTGETSTAVTRAGAAKARADARAKANKGKGNGTTGGTAAPTPTTTTPTTTVRIPTTSKTTPVEVVRDRTIDAKAKANAKAGIDASKRGSRGGGRLSGAGLAGMQLRGAGARRNFDGGKVSKKGLTGDKRATAATDEITAQAIAAREFEFLNQRQSFASSLASNLFERPGTTPGGGVGGGTTVVVNQHFKAPTPDKHREARYARSAMRAALEG